MAMQGHIEDPCEETLQCYRERGNSRVLQPVLQSTSAVHAGLALSLLLCPQGRTESCVASYLLMLPVIVTRHEAGKGERERRGSVVGFGGGSPDS